jgi:hypothetical protein
MYMFMYIYILRTYIQLIPTHIHIYTYTHLYMYIRASFFLLVFELLNLLRATTQFKLHGAGVTSGTQALQCHSPAYVSIGEHR